MKIEYLSNHPGTLDELLAWIAEGTSSHSNSNFFESLVEHLALALQVRCAFVGQCLDAERITVQTLACWLNGEFEKGVQYRVLETPCEAVIREGKMSFYPRDVQAYYPNNIILKRRKAESYLGIPLLDSSAGVIGHLVILDSKPIEDMPGYLAILKIFAARAGAELERLLAEREVRAHAESLEALYDLDQSLLKAQSADEVISQTVKCVGDLVKADRVSVALYDFTRGEAWVTPPIHSTETSADAGRIPLDWIGVTSPDVTPDEEYIQVEDLQIAESDTPINGKLLDMGIRSYIAMAMITPTGRVGSLNIASKNPHAFNKLHINILKEAASHVALAIRNMQLYEAERAERVRVQELQTDLEMSLTELRRAQANLERTARLSAAGELAAGVAHQINNPLTTIIGQSFMLLGDLPEGSPAANSARLIQSAANKAGEVVQRLLDLARTSTYELRPMDLNESINESVNLIRAQLESQSALSINLADKLPRIPGSKHHLSDVWLNLMFNARDALQGIDNGFLAVASSYDQVSKAIKVTVEDNGPGIPDEYQQRIFDPFYTTKAHGNGLGLWIAREVINQHGGTFDVVSRPGQTVFTVTLPVADKRA